VLVAGPARSRYRGRQFRVVESLKGGQQIMAGNTGGPADHLPARRSWGRMTRDRAAGLFDHACWGYADARDRAAAASAWLAEGLRLGQRSLYVADLPVERLVRELGDVPGATAAVDSGALVVMPSTQLYDLTTSIDAAAQLRIYADAVDDALGAGYAGLRVAADITPLVVDPLRRPDHLRWEQYADRYIAEHPLSPLCLFDTRRVMGIDAITCAHPLQGPVEPLFALYAAGATTARLAGEVDAGTADTLREALRALPDTDATLDVSALSFIDGRAAWTLQNELLARSADGQLIQLSRPTKLLRNVWRACGFDPSLIALTNVII
jgi:anti-anti-sigma regulatory factor